MNGGCMGLIKGNKPLSVASISFRLIPSLVTSFGLKTKKEQPQLKYIYKDGEKRFLLRMLPLKAKDGYGDCHLWPKGTYIELNGAPISHYAIQRRQQIHDNSLWKGMSHVFDLTPFIKDPTLMNTLNILSYDEHQYFYQVCFAEFRSPLLIENDLIGNFSALRTREFSIQRNTYDQSLILAKEYVNDQMVVLEDDIDNDRQLSLTFYLCCPISMAAIKTPVRGKSCKHIQCFDLSNYLQVNSFPSGRRWRCVCCDNFVLVEDLVHCGLFEAMIAKSKSLEGVVKNVEFRSNGTWELKPEVKKKKRRNEEEGKPQKRNRTQEIVLCD